MTCVLHIVIILEMFYDAGVGRFVCFFPLPGYVYCYAYLGGQGDSVLGCPVFSLLFYYTFMLLLFGNGDVSFCRRGGM